MYFAVPVVPLSFFVYSMLPLVSTSHSQKYVKINLRHLFHKNIWPALTSSTEY